MAMILGLLIQLAILGGIGYGVYRLVATRRGAAHGVDDVRATVSRFIRLALLFGAIVLAAEGLAGLIAAALPRHNEAGLSATDTARSLALAVVGLPALTGLARWTHERMRTDPDETASDGWSAFVTITEMVALLVATFAWFATITWALAGGHYDRLGIGRATLWTAVWLVAWRLSRRRPAFSAAAQLDLVAGSTIALAELATGSILLLRAILRVPYQHLLFQTLVNEPNAIARPLVTTFVGGCAWSWYWLAHASRGERSTAWHLHVLLVGVFASLVTAVTGAGRIMFATLIWFLGDPDTNVAGRHFVLLPGSAAAVVAGTVSWAYHHRLLAITPTRPRSEVDRIGQYLTAAVGLVTAAVGITAALAATVRAVTELSAVRYASSVANDGILAAALLVVGLPIWMIFWVGAQRRSDVPDERASVTRRVYLLVIFGVAAVVAAVALVLVLMNVFEDIGGHGVDRATIFDVRVPAALVLTMGIVAGYHAVV